MVEAPSRTIPGVLLFSARRPPGMFRSDIAKYTSTVPGFNNSVRGVTIEGEKSVGIHPVQIGKIRSLEII